ncbi:FMRFamide receptor-like [Haliotis rubra]|uniref:FMRFamide receptor-like n=1 Tax=Haliotis rubra TaxID=36100 RepID=UPI001EE53C76|nr:FMRFamide receptor-like [Haliotis rubra]
MESSETTPRAATTSKAVGDIWYICHGILGTAVEVFGVVGNVMSIAVLVHPDMRSSTGILLTSLAVYDIIVLTSYLFLLSMDQIFQHTRVYANFLTDLHQPTYPVWYSMSSIAFMGSSYTTLAISIERLIVVTFPLKASAWCTESRAKAAVILIFIFSALYNIPRYLVFSIVPSWDEATQKNEISLERTEFSKTYFFKAVYSVTMNITIKVFLPLTVLAVSSCFMIRAVRRTGMVRRNLQGGGLGSNHSKFSAMVVAVMVFSMTSLLTGAMEVILLRINDQQFQTADDCEVVCAAVSAVSELMAILNSGINFLLFCVFGSKFREVFRRRFCKRREMAARNSRSYTMSLS